MKRIVIIGICLLVAAGAFLGIKYYKWIYHANTKQGTGNLILLPEGSAYADVLNALQDQDLLINPKAFTWVAKKMRFGDKSIKSGRYYITPGQSNYALIQKLRLGQQDAIDLVIHAAHTVDAVAGDIGRQLEVDSLDLLRFIYDEYLPGSEYRRETLLSLFIPNTYQVWWNLSARKLMERMEQEHDRFWNEKRRTAAEALSMTPEEVYTLASIVESETQAEEERATIAGVYHNRLKRGIPLQADPTIRFAIGDPGIRRVLFRHLEIDSPCNTYLHTGLPPGPIAMPTIHSIDAVLFPESHDFIFFCAKPGYDGRHLFAKTNAAHAENARVYQAWLDQQGIR